MEIRKQLILGLSVLLIGLIFICGCEDKYSVISSQETVPDSGGVLSVVGSINGIITLSGTGSGTGAPVGGTTIEYSVKGEALSTQSSSGGYYAIGGLEEGTHTVTFIPPDTIEATSSYYIIDVSFTFADTIIYVPYDDSYHINISQNVVLYETNSFISGDIFGKLSDDSLIYGAGAEIKIVNLYEDYNIFNLDCRTIADSSGLFTLENVPEVDSVALLVLPWTDGIHYFDAEFVDISLGPGGIVNTGPIITNISAGEVIVLSYNFQSLSFAVDDTLTMTFNKEMDISSVWARLSRETFPYNEIPISLSWDEDGIILTVDPQFTLLVNTDYTLQVGGRSVDYSDLDWSAGFTTQDGINIIQTNLSISELPIQDFNPSDTIWVVFNIPANISHPENSYKLKDTNGYEIWINTIWENNSTKLQVIPHQNLEFGINYEFGFKVFSTIPGDSLSILNEPFEFSTSVASIIPEAPSGFICLNEDSIDYDTRSIKLQWELCEDAQNYLLYISNNYNNTYWINFSTYSNPDVFWPYETIILLPTYFDWLTGDGITTPFSNGIEVSLFLMAQNGPNFSDPSNTIILTDAFPPFPILDQHGSANNSISAIADTFTIDFLVDIEYCNSNYIPVFGFIEDSDSTSGDTSFVIDNSEAIWEWDTNSRNGIFTIVVPDSSDGSFDKFYCTNIYDNSGNVQIDTSWIVLY